MENKLLEHSKKIICILLSLALAVTIFFVPASVYAEGEATVPEEGPIPQDVVEPKPIYYLNFNANGGKVSRSKQEIQYNRIYGALPKPTRSGYVFRGWYTAKTGGSLVTQFTRLTAKKSVTVYARWQKTLSYQQEVRKYVNVERKKRKLVLLAWDSKLYKGTSVRATEITKRFSHTRPNGGSGARFLLKYVKKGRASGECLGKGFDDPKKLVAAFMRSPSHYRIIMMKKARTVATTHRVKGGSTYWCLGTSVLYR